MNINEMQDERRAKLSEARKTINSITDKTPADKAFRAERKFDLLMKEADELSDQIAEARGNELVERPLQGADGSAPGVDNGSTDHHTRAFSDWLRSPGNERAKAKLAAVEERLGSGLTGGAGGFVVPEEIITPIMSRAKDANPFRNLVRVISVTTSDIVLPLSQADATSGWVGEGDTRTATTEPTLVAKVPTFGTAYANVSMTEELAADAKINIAEWFSDEAGRTMGEAEMASIISGDGNDKPTGLLNVAPESAADGSRTTDALRYIASGDAADLTAPDILLDTYYDLKTDYRANASWVMNSNTAAVVRKMKDGDGTYLWHQSFRDGQPSRLLGYPVVIAEAMEDIGTNTHPIMFGDFRRGYVLCNRANMAALPDPYTVKGQIQLYLRYRVGGCVFDENAIRVIKCATS